MKLSFEPFELKLRYPFGISGYSRSSTPLILLKVEHDGQVGYGEASMVPYMGESPGTATAFLNKVDLRRFKIPIDFDEVVEYLDALNPGNPAIKAAIDIALHDLEGKIRCIPCYSMFNSNPDRMPVTTITIGIDTPEMVVKKVEEAEAAHVLKVKLGSDDDQELVRTIRSISNKPLFADANQGWKDKFKALDMLHWLKEQGVRVVEQPMEKGKLEENAWITERSPLPILADESFQRLGDLERIKGAYHGINVKLMKSAGMHEAFKMIRRARELDMKILIGCMSETSIPTLAGAALAPLCDWADLDGPFLTSNNPFNTPAFQNGRWILSDTPGLGLVM
ncbi:dipeptide epimerase [Desertivirga brevis]|uniref:dipeptide epimerase n=1 Tax=Desertivirga brevis TaxID=2810310 RepID=UPI001A976F4E|nr:dipeptide epimerase [Pedobacter sp. SYSU D00873]